MAPKKNKSKVEEETVANMSTGWCKSKMSESLVQELKNMGLLQEQGVSQWRADEGEDYPMEGTLETVMFRDFMEHDLTLPVSEFFYRLLQFWEIQLHHLTPQSILHLSIFTHFCEVFLGILPYFHLFRHFFCLIPVPNATNPAVVGGCEFVLRPETQNEYLAYDPSGKGAEWKKLWFMSGTLNLHFQKESLVPPKSKKIGRVMDLVASKLSASSKLLPNGKIKESTVIMWSSPL